MVVVEHPDPHDRTRRLPRRAVEILGATSRRIQGRWGAGRLTSAVTRRLATRLVNTEVYSYRDPWGHVVEADLSDFLERAGFLGAHSPVLLRNLERIVGPGDWAIDVGANVGLLTSRLCGLVGSNGEVWAIEPLPRNIVRLQRLQTENGLTQLKVFPIALSSEAGMAGLRLPIRGGGAFGSFVATWETLGEIEVPTTPLDDLFAQHPHPSRLRLLKIDAEGFEPQVLKGAARTIAVQRPLVLCEFNDILLRQAGSSSTDLLAAFSEMGYFPSTPLEPRPRSLRGRTIDLLMAHESEARPQRSVR